MSDCCHLCQKNKTKTKKINKKIKTKLKSKFISKGLQEKKNADTYMSLQFQFLTSKADKIINIIWVRYKHI